MLVAIVTICGLTGPCDRIRVPGEFASPVTCAVYGQAFIASSALSISGRTVRVICRPKQHVEAKR